MALWPGLAISIVAYSINMFGDAVRDLLDPKLRGSVGGLGVHGAKLAKKAKARHIVGYAWTREGTSMSAISQGEA